MPKSTKSFKLRRHSTPSGSQPSTSMGAPSTSQSFWPPQGMVMMCPPWAMGGSSVPPAPAASTALLKGKRPWDEVSASSSSSSDDFQLSQKKKLASKKTSGKRGPGRPSKAEVAAKNSSEKKESLLLKSYPPKFNEVDVVEHREENECRKCRIYRGCVALVPCGHGKFCISCVNDLLDNAVNSKKPQKCLLAECQCTVRTWVKLFHHTV